MCLLSGAVERCLLCVQVNNEVQVVVCSAVQGGRTRRSAPPDTIRRAANHLDGRNTVGTEASVA